MNSDLIKIWLKSNNSSQMVKKCLAAFFSLIGGIITLFITFWITYFVTWLALSGFLSVVELVMGTKLKIGNAWLLIISGFFIVILFIQYIRMDSWSWGRYKQTEVDLDPRLRSDISELVPSTKILEHSGALAKSIADLLVVGPRLFLGAFVRLRELSEIRHVEIEKCAGALAFIYSQPDVVTYEEFCEAGWGEQLGQLKNIEGVNYLKSGLLLSEELKSELNNLR